MTDPETYALGLIGEETSEVGQAQGKWLRFGADTVHKDGRTARGELEHECGDVLAAIEYNAAAGTIDIQNVLAQYERKRRKLADPDSRDDTGKRLAPEVGLRLVSPLFLSPAARADV